MNDETMRAFQAEWVRIGAAAVACMVRVMQSPEMQAYLRQLCGHQLAGEAFIASVLKPESPTITPEQQARLRAFRDAVRERMAASRGKADIPAKTVLAVEDKRPRPPVH